MKQTVIILLSASRTISNSSSSQPRMGLFHQHMTHQAGLQASGAYGLQLLAVIYQSAAGAAPWCRRDGAPPVSQFVRDGKRFLHRIGDLASGHLDTQGVHGILKFDPVLAALNGVYLNADDLNVIFFQDAFLCKLRTEIQSGLSAQVGEQGRRDAPWR